jgi:LmbE family N-acetylglucosaminyl deacetylase
MNHAAFRLLVWGIVLVGALGCPPQETSTVPDDMVPGLAQLPPELESAKRILWVFAHPDDESTAVPLIVHACRKASTSCAFLVFTRGEGGNCGLESCLPDLGAFRAKEMRASAALLSSAIEVVQWDLGNQAASTPEQSVANFAARAGGMEALTRQVTSELERQKPDAIVTFDPRNGVTCHPDHRAVSMLTLLTLRSRPLVDGAHTWLTNTRLVSDSNTQDPNAGSWVGLSPWADTPAALKFDATQAWPTLLNVLRAHRSQFSDEIIAKFSSAPSSAKILSLVALRDTKEGETRYEGCP